MVLQDKNKMYWIYLPLNKCRMWNIFDLVITCVIYAMDSIIAVYLACSDLLKTAYMIAGNCVHRWAESWTWIGQWQNNERAVFWGLTFAHILIETSI